MKQKNIAVIIIVAFVSAILSFFLSSRIFVTSENRQQRVEVVDVIDPEFSQPNPSYFNAQSINSARASQLGGNTNQTPFNSQAQ